MLEDKSIKTIHKLLKDHKISFMDIAEEVICNIKDREPSLKAYITLCLEDLRKDARLKDEKNMIPKHPLDGMPISVKDTFTTKGIKTTAASKILEKFYPPYDATAYARLRKKGCLLVGKTNMDEFAHGFTCEYSAFHPTYNPWNIDKVSGGSSGGCAVSVASLTSILSLASENFGSITQPAGLCGVVGMKPTYARSSRYGIIAMASSLECPGIMGRCVEDVALGIEVISGIDKLDATSFAYPKESFSKKLNANIKARKIAIIRPFMDKLNLELVKILEQAIQKLKKLGVLVQEIDWYDEQIDGKIYDILYKAEVASNLARFDGIRYGYRQTKKFKNLDEFYLASRDKFGEHVKRQITTDPVTLSVHTENVYYQALKQRRKNQEHIDKVFEQYDAILLPASVFLDLDIGKIFDQNWREENRDLAQIYQGMVCPTALYGYPSISFPIGFSSSNMPVGACLYAKRFAEQVLLDIGFAFEQATGLKFLDPYKGL